MKTSEQKQVEEIKNKQLAREKMGHDDEKFHEINWLIKRVEDLECLCDNNSQCLFHKNLMENKKGAL